MAAFNLGCPSSSLPSSSPLNPSLPIPSCPPPHLFFHPKLKSQIYRRRLFARAAAGNDANGDSFNGFHGRPGKIFVEEEIGAEYGEGFETFRPNGPLKIDVDFLNDRMQEGFLQRIRYMMKPDEAFGLIFSWDNVVADTQSLKLKAWKQLSIEEGKEIPTEDNVQKVVLNAGADFVLYKVLNWTSEESEMERMKLRLSQLYLENLVELNEPIEGLAEWLDAVYSAGIPCSIVTSLDKHNLTSSLQRMGLNKYIQAIVTEEDGMESMAHRFLSAAVKLDRKPSKCIVFEDDPKGITAAHNCTMMAVGLIGPHPAYELGQADVAVASFTDLSVINLRRLFANKGSRFMDLQKQVTDKSPPKRKLTTDTIF